MNIDNIWNIYNALIKYHLGTLNLSVSHYNNLIISFNKPAYYVGVKSKLKADWHPNLAWSVLGLGLGWVYLRWILKIKSSFSFLPILTLKGEIQIFNDWFIMQKKTDAYVLPVFSIAKILLAFTGQVHVKVLPV